MKIELEVGQHGDWTLKMQGVDCRDALVLVQSSMASALGELVWEGLSKRPFAIIEKASDGKVYKSIDEKTHAEQAERRRVAQRRS